MEASERELLLELLEDVLSALRASTDEQWSTKIFDNWRICKEQGATSEQGECVNNVDTTREDSQSSSCAYLLSEMPVYH